MAYNLTLEYQEQNIFVNSSIHKIKGSSIDEELEIETRSIKGDKVFFKTLNADDNKPIKMRRCWVDEDGNVIPKKAVKYFLKKNGIEQEVKPFSMTKRLVIQTLINSVDVEQFIPYSVYELTLQEDTDIAGFNNLLKFAEFLEFNNKVAVAKYSFGRGFKDYYALIKPIFIGGKFTFKIVFCESKIEFNHLLDKDLTINVNAIENFRGFNISGNSLSNANEKMSEVLSR